MALLIDWRYSQHAGLVQFSESLSVLLRCMSTLALRNRTLPWASHLHLKQSRWLARMGRQAVPARRTNRLLERQGRPPKRLPRIPKNNLINQRNRFFGVDVAVGIVCGWQERGYRDDGIFYNSDGDQVHTVTCSSTATQEDMMDFLNE